MKFALLLAIGVLLAAIPANAMDAETFFIKAVALKKKGMGAVFAKDLKPMMRVFEAAAKAVKAENDVARTIGAPLLCEPKKISPDCRSIYQRIQSYCQRTQTNTIGSRCMARNSHPPFSLLT